MVMFFMVLGSYNNPVHDDLCALYVHVCVWVFVTQHASDLLWYLCLCFDLWLKQQLCPHSFKCVLIYDVCSSYPAFQPKWWEAAEQSSVRGRAHDPESPAQPQVPALPGLQRLQQLQRGQRGQRGPAEGQSGEPRVHGVAVVPGRGQYVRQSECVAAYRNQK